MKKLLILIIILQLVITNIYCSDNTSDLIIIKKKLNDLNFELGKLSKTIDEIKFEKNWKELLPWLVPLIFTILLAWILYQKDKKLLFSTLIQEYSSKEMYDAIYKINDFAKIIYEINKKKSKSGREKKLINEYIKLEKVKGQKVEYTMNGRKYTFQWSELDYNRRLIANYFIKVFLFYSKWMIPRCITKTYWSINFLLSDIIIILDYVAKPIIMNNIKPDEYYKDKKLMLVEYYNKYIDPKNKIKINDLKKLYNDLAINRKNNENLKK